MPAGPFKSISYSIWTCWDVEGAVRTAIDVDSRRVTDRKTDFEREAIR